MEKNKLPEILIEIRAILDFSQKELGKEIGTHQTTIANWESGTHFPTRRWLSRLVMYVRERKLNDQMEALRSLPRETS